MSLSPRMVLVTGFDPFADDVVNSSWEAARALEGWACGEARVHVRQTPCVFGTAIEVLAQAIAELQPELVFCLGQSGGRSELAFERVAINVDDGRIADNAGRQPIDEPVVAGGPAAYFSSLPIKAIVRDVRQAGIPATVSNTAGTFVCNHLFYGLMHELERQPRREGAPSVRGGFVHVPYLPRQAQRLSGQASMAVETAAQGLRVAIATALATQQDIKETEGKLH